ncbi:MAG: ribosome biogenesis/translation initiation ATPase RLI [Candidatus Aenigmatarchaeota archaeon]
MRIAVVDKKLCRPDKCSLECVNVCPRNRAGDKCVWAEGSARIDENICIGCGLCVKKCPFGAISVINTPEQLREKPVHRFGRNGFALFRLPYPVKGEVVGLLGPNGVGKTTSLHILSGEIKPNLGTDAAAGMKELISIFRGTEMQAYLEELERKKIKAVVKPQVIDILSNVKGTVRDVLKKHDERGLMDEIAKRLGLEQILDRELSKLSGGELQRVAIAIAANRKADIYYIDEPSSYLDVFQRMQAAKLLRELAKEASVVVVEHDLATLDFLADRVHIYYGAPGVFGVVSKPYSTRVGINAFLDGYIKEDNVRIRSEPIHFGSAKLETGAKGKVFAEWGALEKGFKGFALRVSAGSVREGEIIGVLGGNALGKTTFARMLAGEIRPDKGEIKESVKISYKPQYISNDFDGTVTELLSTAKKNVLSEEYRAEILRPLQIERVLEQPVKSLSGGELQRVAIALCLSREADLYLLDEPSAFLDSEQRLAAARTIRKFCELKGCSGMVIDHDLLFLSYVSDRAMVFSGKPSVSGEASQMGLQEGFNAFLKEAGVTFRKDPQTNRPRANKPGSQKDDEQKAEGKYFYAE